MSRRSLALGVWLGCMVLAAIIVARARYIADLSAFLPARPTPTQQLLIDQLRDGPASRLMFIAIEQADSAGRAQIALAMASQLRRDAQFSSVNDGEQVGLEHDRDFLFDHRYLLSDSVSAQRFSAAGLHAAIQDTIEDLASPAGLLLKSLLPRDPTGEFPHLLDQLSNASQPSSSDGVWTSRDGARALMVVQTAASGSDTDAQERAIAAIRSAFAASSHAPSERAGAQLRLSGPGVFAVMARAKIKTAVLRLSIASSVLVIVVLLAVYRSVPALILGLLPVTTGALLGIAAVALAFGAIHGVTLGFGITLIGESVDYSIYFFVQSSRSQPGTDPLAWQRLWWPTIRLGMLTSVCGFASLLPSGFPGLAQLGLYSITGLIAAALVTRYVLPSLLPRGFAIHDLRPFGTGIARLLRPVREHHGLVIAASVAAALLAVAVLYQHRATLWNRELSALSPVSAADQDFDAKLRADLGAADTMDLVIVSGPTLDAALRGAEQAGAALRPLVEARAIGGFDSPVNYLPSLETQKARRDSLPDAATLSADLRRASLGLPLQSERLQPFVADVETARQAGLLSRRDLQGSSLGAAFDALIMQQKDRWNALLPLHAAAPGQAIDTARVIAALRLARVDEARVLDLKQESDALYSSYLAEAIHLSLAGFGALIVLLAVALRSAARVARVLAPLALAVLVVASALAHQGVQLTILHLVGMLLIVAVGSNYALFIDRQGNLDEAGGEPLTLASLAIANICTVIGFGLLSFSQVPVLVALGTTVAPGALLALLFAAALSPRESHA
jgi:predicted exporter